MQPRLTHQVLTSEFKLLHKLRLNITGKFRGAVTWDESVVTVGGPQPSSPPHELTSDQIIHSAKPHSYEMFEFTAQSRFKKKNPGRVRATIAPLCGECWNSRLHLE